MPQRFPVGLLHCSHRHKAPHHRIGSMCVFCLRIRYLSCKVWYGPKNEGIKWKMLQLCQVYPEKHVKKKKKKPVHTNVDHFSSMFNLNMSSISWWIPIVFEAIMLSSNRKSPQPFKCTHKWKATTCNNLVIQKKIKQTPVHGLSMCNLGRGVQRKCSSNPHLSLIGPAVQIDCLLLGTVGLDAK